MGVAITFRNFPTWTKAQLEARLTELQEELGSGASEISGGTGEVNFALQTQTSTEGLIQKVLWDLYLLDPVTYPAGLGAKPRSAVGRLIDSNQW